MILCVANVLKFSKGGKNDDVQWGLELTDGWYSIGAQVDKELASLLAAGWKGKQHQSLQQQPQLSKDANHFTSSNSSNRGIQIGDKLCIQNAKFNATGPYTGMSPLDAAVNALDSSDRSQPTLLITKNSTRRAKWDSKLGFQKIAKFPVSLASLTKGGGEIGFITLRVVRVYPIQFMEKLKGSGNQVVRDSVGEDIAAELHRKDISIRPDHYQQNSFGEQPQEDSQTRKDEILSHIDDSQRRQNIEQILKNGETNLLTNSQREIVEKASEKSRAAKEERMFSERMRFNDNNNRNDHRRSSSGENVTMSRNVQSLMRLIVTDVSSASLSTAALPSLCEFVIWGVTENQRERIVEGSILTASRLSVGWKSRYLDDNTIPGCKATEISLRSNPKRSSWDVLITQTKASSPLISNNEQIKTPLMRKTHSTFMSLSSCIKGEFVDIIGMVLQAPNVNHPTSSLHHSVTAYLGDDTGCVIAVVIPHTGSSKYDVTVQSCVRSGIKNGNIISIHNLMYERYNHTNNTHVLRWVLEHSGVGKFALSRSMFNLVKKRIHKLTKYFSQTVEGTLIKHALNINVSQLGSSSSSSSSSSSYSKDVEAISSSNHTTIKGNVLEIGVPCESINKNSTTTTTTTIKVKDTLFLRLCTSLDGIKVIKIYNTSTNNSMLWKMLKNITMNPKYQKEDDEEEQQQQPTNCLWYNPTQDIMRLCLKMSICNDDDTDVQFGVNVTVEPLILSVQKHFHHQSPSTSKLVLKRKPKQIILQVQKIYYDDIFQGIKTWESRLYQEHYHGSLMIGDHIMFCCYDKKVRKQLLMEIQEIRRYETFPCFYNMLQDIGLKNCLPRIKTIEDGVNIYRSFPNYQTYEKQRGAIAFKLCQPREH
jgi:ASC-1-like (ASCH) protein